MRQTQLGGRGDVSVTPVELAKHFDRNRVIHHRARNVELTSRQFASLRPAGKFTNAPSCHASAQLEYMAQSWDREHRVGSPKVATDQVRWTERFVRRRAATNTTTPVCGCPEP
jgi:hypothetical protein